MDGSEPFLLSPGLLAKPGFVSPGSFGFGMVTSPCTVGWEWDQMSHLHSLWDEETFKVIQGFPESSDGPNDHFKQLLPQLILVLRGIAEDFEMVPLWGHLLSQLWGLQAPHAPDAWEGY